MLFLKEQPQLRMKMHQAEGPRSSIGTGPLAENASALRPLAELYDEARAAARKCLGGGFSRKEMGQLSGVLRALKAEFGRNGEESRPFLDIALSIAQQHEGNWKNFHSDFLKLKGYAGKNDLFGAAVDLVVGEA